MQSIPWSSCTQRQTLCYDLPEAWSENMCAFPKLRTSINYPMCVNGFTVLHINPWNGKPLLTHTFCTSSLFWIVRGTKPSSNGHLWRVSWIQIGKHRVFVLRPTVESSLISLLECLKLRIRLISGNISLLAQVQNFLESTETASYFLY